MDDLSFAIAQPGIAMPCCDPFAKQVPAARHSTNRSPVAGIRDPELAEIDLESAMRSAAWHAPAVLDERMRLEEETQRVLLRYLDGDEVPQKRADFADALATTEKLLTLSGPSLYFEARREFFAGRTLLFDRKYEEAASRLENAIRLDPASPYSWNALGIAYLEQGRLGEAENAFLDAIGRARYWAYPRHNLALVYLQRGDYAQVIDTYRTAMRLAPQYSYLPYNLGLVFQKMGLLEQAETQYLAARTKAQWRPQPWIALATLLSELGRDREAERYFAAAAEALHKAPDDTALAALRHNRALYLAKKPSSLAEAETLLEENIAQFEYLPSRFALVQLLASAWRRNRSSPFLLDSAVKSCRVLVSAVPANASARSECADLLLEAKRKPEAVELLRAGLDYAAARQAISQKLRSLSAPQR
jgi:tetratricopeptide (TPR) repeat protein